VTSFISTRGLAPAISFRDAVLSGLAPDGGLYLPAHWPRIDPAIGRLSFPEAAAAVLGAYAGDEIDAASLLAIARSAYASFDDPANVAPLVALGDGLYLLELFRGPTLAFKDVAMQMLGALYDWALHGSGRKKTIISATSGDTGGAAAFAFAGKASAEIFILHPAGRISEVQRRMMTTTGAANVVNIAVDGSFDDCQAIVKALFADASFASKLDLGGVNSINWVRLAAQAVYYFTAAERLDATAHYVVPTGNFGDIFAGYAAAMMGAPVARLCAAVNTNDIVSRVIETGRYAPGATSPTYAPSMDIQVASNFERLLFEASGRDGAAVRALMEAFAREGAFSVPDSWRRFIDLRFCAARVGDEETLAEIGARYRNGDGLVDPHTAIGLSGARKLIERGAIEGPTVVLATAHPAKFPDAVRAGAGETPALPPRFAGLFDRREDMIAAPADARSVGELILARSSARL
jgi:threonine synthase